MERIVLKIDTFACGSCGYYQDFSPVDEPEKHTRIYPNVPAGSCPACFTGQNDERVKRSTPLAKVVDLSRMTTTTSASDSELESTRKPEFDQNGNPVLEQVDERKRLSIVNDSPAIVTEPVFDQKRREITDTELAELKLQRDENLDALEAVAVTEV